MGGYRRIDPKQLREVLSGAQPPIVLDVRTREAFAGTPGGIAGAIPVFLDAPELRVPPLAADQPVVCYCLCTTESASSRVALWLAQAGHRAVSVLVGGLSAWEEAGGPLSPVRVEEPGPDWKLLLPDPPADGAAAAPSGLVPFLFEQTFLAGVELPVRREMAVLFADMVESTALLYHHPPDRVLELVQAFMEVVVDVAVHHCGDVKDFEGDGAMLVFGGPGEALAAAFRLRDALDLRRRALPELPHARFSLDAGPLVVGEIGTRLRRALSFVGPAVNVAARILKLAPPHGIVATEEVMSHCRVLDPALAARFAPMPEPQVLRGVEDGPVRVYVAE